MRWFGKFLFFTGLVGLLLGAVVVLFFTAWKNQRLEVLAAGGTVVQTSLGQVEYAETSGDGPVILVLHGGAGGYDQGLVLARSLSAAGFRVIALSRPGYLQTPLASGILPEQQADLAASFLEELQIPKAGLLAFGEAAPVGVEACLRHPDKFDRLALLSPVVLRTTAAPAEFPLPGEAILGHLTGDMGSWWLDLMARYRSLRSLRLFLETTTDLNSFECLKLAESVVEHSGQLEWFRDFVRSMSPLSPRESGTRNDIVQLQALPALNFQNITQSVLLLTGANDSIISGANAGAIRDIPGLREEELTDAGFLLPGLGPSASTAEEILTEFFQPQK